MLRQRLEASVSCARKTPSWLRDKTDVQLLWLQPSVRIPSQERQLSRTIRSLGCILYLIAVNKLRMIMTWLASPRLNITVDDLIQRKTSSRDKMVTRDETMEPLTGFSLNRCAA